MRKKAYRISRELNCISRFYRYFFLYFFENKFWTSDKAGLKQIQLDEEAEEKSKLHTSADEGLDLGKNRISTLALIMTWF